MWYFIVSLIEGNSSLKEQVEREKPEDVPEKPGMRWPPIKVRRPDAY
jgi:hypothetical protein